MDPDPAPAPAPAPAALGLPEDRTTLYFERAKQLSLISTGSSLELERQLREVYKALSYQSEEVKLFLLLGKIYKQNLDLSSALFCYRLALKKDPSNAVAQKVLVQLLGLKGKELMLQAVEMQWPGKYHSARSLFEEALEYARDNDELLFLKTVCHVHCNELTEAFETINKALQPHKAPKAEALILRAKINWGRGLVEQGNQDIRTAAGLDSAHPEVVAYIERSYAKSEKLYNLSLKLFGKGHHKEALEHIRHAIFLTNEDVKLYIVQSKILRMLRDQQGAYESILQARAIFEARSEGGTFPLRLPPEITSQTHLILNEIAMESVTRGDYDQAILLYNRVIREMRREDPRGADYRYFLNRGDCYRAQGLWRDAVLDYQDAMELEPGDWNVNVRLSLTHYRIGLEHFNAAQFLDAEAELSSALTHNPKVAEYWALRGKARYYTNNFKNAYEDFKRALALDPDNMEVRGRLQQFESDDADLLLPADPGLHGPAAADASAKPAQPAQKKSRRELLEALEAQSSYVTEKSVQAVRPQDADVIAAMLHPTVRYPPLNYLHQVELDATARAQRQKQQKPLALRIDRAIDNSGHVVKKPLPLLLANTPVMTHIEQHSFRNAILATERVHEKSVAVVRQYLNKPSVAKGPMWGIVDTAKALALSSTSDRHKREAKKQQQHARTGGAGRTGASSA